MFGRAPDYDTNDDPVVRTTVAEIRKRLQQYYQTPEHDQEIRAYFPSGSYAAEFRLPPKAPSTGPAEEAVVPVAAPRNPVWWRQWQWVGAAVPGVALGGWLLVRAFAARDSALNCFWDPITDSPFVTLYVSASSASPPGLPSKSGSGLGKQAEEDLPPQGVAFGDVLATTRIAGLLGSRGIAFHVREAPDAVLDDLREGPAVLIGAFDNSWTALGS